MASINAKITKFIKEKMDEKGFSQKDLRLKIVRDGKAGICSSTISEKLSGGDIYVDHVFQMLNIMEVGLYWDGKDFYEMSFCNKEAIRKVLEILQYDRRRERDVMLGVIDVFHKKFMEALREKEKLKIVKPKKNLKKGGKT